MALFGNKKDEQAAGAVPPAPPTPSGALPAAPPIPGAPPVSQEKEVLPPMQEMQNLSAPPMPGGTLSDIKEQVAAPPISPNSTPETQEDTPSIETPKEEEIIDNEDSLFDFSELDIQAPAIDPQEENLSEDNEEEVEQEGIQDDDNINLNFIDAKRKSKADETYFVTTKQFKALLEVVENVKKKTKEASETHLRLLDIKAEEDIEYENLRKSFQYIEEKLYEVDSIIFDK